MFRIVRGVTALLIAVVCATAPLVLDECTASCEALQSGAASTPACHHSADLGARIGHQTAVCSHDRDGTATTTLEQPLRNPLRALVAIAVELPAIGADDTALSFLPPSDQPVHSRLLAHNRPLRV